MEVEPLTNEEILAIRKLLKGKEETSKWITHSFHPEEDRGKLYVVTEAKYAYVTT